MKRRLHIVIACVLVFLVVGAFVGIQIANASIGNLQIFKGNADVVRNGQVNHGNTGFPVLTHDILKLSPVSRVAIVLKDNSVIRIEEGSEVDVSNITYEGGKIKDAEFKLKTGKLWVRAAPVALGGKVDVETPTVTASVRGTSFNTTSTNGITGIFVYRHKVLVTLLKTGKEQTVEKNKLLQMHNSSLQEDFTKGTIVPPDAFFDDWIKFNIGEDNKLCATNHIPDCDEVSSTPDSLPPTPTSSPSATVTPTPELYYPTYTPIPFPTYTPTPTAKLMTPTPTQYVTPTQTPTPTYAPPTSTPTPTPTRAPTRPPIPTRTPTPTPPILY